LSGDLRDVHATGPKTFCSALVCHRYAALNICNKVDYDFVMLLNLLQTLAKVICTVLRFTGEQTRKVMERV